MEANEDNIEASAWQKADARVLGQILAAQNIELALPDTIHIAEFYSETLMAIPGIASCCICLANFAVQKGDMENERCKTCQALRTKPGKQKGFAPFDQSFTCGLADQPGVEIIEINSLYHPFGLFILRPDDPDIFNIYKPFIGNLANYLAISLENRLQRDLLQKAHDELEQRVEERTKDLVETNASLQEEIEHRRKLENALKESLEQFRAVAESASEAIISADSQGTIVYWNKAAQVIYGYSSEEVLGQSVYMLVSEQDHEQLDDASLWDANGVHFQVGKVLEMAGRRKDGSIFPVEISVGAWNTQEGQFYTAMVRDITERKQAEINLRLLSAALEAAANAIVIADRMGRITWVNPAFTRLTGYSAQEVIGKAPRLLTGKSHDPLSYENIWNTILSGRIWHGEQTSRHKDGHIYIEEMTIAPVQQQQGEISHFVAIKQDISERKRHDQEREAVISVADAMRSISTRAELVTVFLNQIKDLFSAEGTMLATQSITTGESIIEMGCGVIGERFSGLHIPPGEGICYQVISSRKPYLSNMATADPRFFRPDLLGNSRSVACIPLIAQEMIIGALWMMREREIVESEVSLLTAIANLAANAIHRVTLYEQTVQQLRRMAALHQIDMAITADFDLRNVLNVLLDNVTALLDVDAADVLLLAPGSQAMEYAAGVGFRNANIERSRILMGEGRAGAAALEQRIVSLPDLNQAQDIFSRTVLLSGEGFVSHIVAPLIAKGQVKGVLEVFKRSRLAPVPEWFYFFQALSTQAAIAIENKTLFSELQQSNSELVQAYNATIEGWAHALDLRDKETEGHTRRVTEMTLRLAQAIGVSEANLVNMYRGAILHDIGKMGIPDDILFKPSYLTEDEWSVMRKHPDYAYQMLSPIHYLQSALNIPYCHHEKWDGSGYPRGLKGEEIPLEARIFSVIDVWDALCSNRRYREAWEENKVLEYIRDQAGKQFDPGVVETFLKVQPWKGKTLNAQELSS